MSQPARPAAPKPTPKPGQVKVFRALYSYEAQFNDELSFDEGDLLYVLDMSNPSWWKAKSGKQTGLIPSNYVEMSMESVPNPLHEAAKRGNLDFLQECLSNEVSVNGLDKSGSTALHWAASGGHIDCMKVLLSKANISINVPNKLGDAPLHSAAWKGFPEAVKLLLAKNARTDIKNNDGKTPYDLASKPEIAVLLKPTFTRVDDGDYLDDEDSD
ncbi:osteoclast-stimulating factor 1-like [Anneissia japonica]|uniref:osteoclast-stimulating factor 1-like n=1 Tax=Anneissia japonica TaxID=1529436 RepID=UPI0014255C4C|nr:osteoclast-stimulating factor 1-like [Anneissia japonica]